MAGSVKIMSSSADAGAVTLSKRILRMRPCPFGVSRLGDESKPSVGDPVDCGWAFPTASGSKGACCADSDHIGTAGEWEVCAHVLGDFAQYACFVPSWMVISGQDGVDLSVAGVSLVIVFL
ncbi:hypothetical protein FRC0190_00033 [Corynebacterium rouxii]|uniref:Uncharacterized protein n=1 Tax=Corynebacterium rouxii TaxID=2719119 RepID=A0A6I8MCN4_9CORY|nr:hypothetical protein FRC0190_00033 [Corynebacterium rouxii]